MRNLPVLSLLLLLCFQSADSQCGMNIAFSSIIPVSCNGGNNGSVTVSVTGGVAPYTYNWSPSGGTSASAIGLAAGSYTVFVTDATLCTQSQSVVVTQPNPIVVSILSTIPATCSMCNGSVSTTATGGNPAYSVIWIPSGGPSFTATNLCAGTYTVVVTDGNGCTGIAAPLVPNGFLLNGTVTDANCSDGAIDITPSCGVPPYTYLWNVGATSEDLFAIPPGTYSVLVTASNLATNTASFVVNGNGPAPGCAYVRGKLFWDLNTNCTYDVPDIPLINEVLSVSPGPMYTTTNSAGDYLLVLPYGNFTINHLPSSPWGNYCPGNSINITTSSVNNNLINNNFADTLSANIDLAAIVYCPPLRPGFANNFTLQFRNNSNVPVNALGWFIPDDTLIYIGASPAPSYINGDTLFWNLNTMNPQAMIPVFVTCSVPANIALIGYQTVNCCGVLPVIGDMNPQDNTWCCDRTISASYDPNAKYVSPEGTGPQGFIATADSILSYTVFFQNTGTDTAFNIVVRDTLSPNLDPLSIELGPGSHPFTFSMSGNCVLKWTFNNILLPDSNVNEPGSHGYFSYKVKQRPNLQPGTQILNEADIYFDFNPPVITNQAINTIEFPLSLSEDFDGTVQMNVFPNPSRDQFTVNLFMKEVEWVDLDLFDITGKRVLNIHSGVLSKGKNQFLIKADQLPDGIYFLKLNSSLGTVTRKLVRVN